METIDQMAERMNNERLARRYTEMSAGRIHRAELARIARGEKSEWDEQPCSQSRLATW